MRYVLVATVGEETRRIPLGEGENILGSAPGCDVVLDDPSVSRRHASLRPGPGGVLVTDLDSRNGTRVRGRRIGAEEVRPA